MVKLTGPLISIEASGTLGKLLTYNQQPRGTTLRKKPQPKHPRTGAQVAVQSALTFVTQQWSSLNQAEQDTWDDPIFVDAVSPYTNYVKFNCQRIRRLLPPIVEYSPDIYGYTCQGFTPAAEGRRRHVYLWWRCYAALAQTWGIFIYRDTAPWPPADFHKLCHVGLMDDALPHTHLDEHLEPGTYYYRFQGFSTGGRITGPAYRHDIVVTD